MQIQLIAVQHWGQLWLLVEEHGSNINYAHIDVPVPRPSILRYPFDGLSNELIMLSG